MSARSVALKRPRIAAPPSKAKLRLWLRLLRAARTIEAELRERLRIHFDTTMPRFDVMAALARRDHGMTMTALSRDLLVSNGNVTGIIDRLVNDGLVVRATNTADRRTTFVRLTSTGQTAFDAMAAAHEEWVGELLAGVAPDDAETLMSLLSLLSPDRRPEK